MEPETETTLNRHSGPGWFQPTHWSVIFDACQESAQTLAALSRLCQAYWFPLYSYVRRVGHSPEDAQDLTQSFFARLLEKDYLKAAAPEKGKFRTFLLVALKRFLISEWHRGNRQKRGGEHEIISIDGLDTENRYASEPVEKLTPEKLFDRRWARALLDQVMSVLEAEFSTASKAQVFKELKPLLSGDETELSYRDIAYRLGMSEGTLRVAVHRLRQRYRQLLRAEIGRTVDTPGAIDDEIRELFNAVS